MSNTQVYDKNSIISMDPIEHIRKRAGMYVGSLDEDGLHHMLNEVIDNAVNDAKRNIEGHALNIALSASRKGLVTHDESSTIIENGKDQKFLEG